MNVNERGQIDIFTYDDNFFFVYKDIYSSFVILKLLNDNDVNEIADKLIDIFSIIGPPKKLETTNRSFENYDKLIDIIKIKMPDLDLIINDEKLVDINSNINYIKFLNNWKKCHPNKSWNEGLKYLQITENTKYIFDNKKSPAELMFGYHIHDNLLNMLNKNFINTANNTANSGKEKKKPSKNKQNNFQ